jgi:transposase
LPSIKQYQEQIATLFAAHPDALIFASFPGAGPVLAPRLLALFGSRRERWNSSTEVATHSGIAPVIERSGKRCLVHWRSRLSQVRAPEPARICQKLAPLLRLGTSLLSNPARARDRSPYLPAKYAPAAT